MTSSEVLLSTSPLILPRTGRTSISRSPTLRPGGLGGSRRGRPKPYPGIFLDGLRDGWVLQHQIESLAPGNDGKGDEDFIGRLLLVLGDLGVRVDDDPVAEELSCACGYSDGEGYEGDSNGSRLLAEDAVSFLEDLNSAIGDPLMRT